MKNNILKQYYLDTEKYYLDMNKEKASAILEECKKFRIYHKYDKDNPLNNLLLNYMKMKEKNKEAVLDDILDKYGINYNSSVQSAISYLLNDSPYTLLWPGIISKDKVNSKYILETKHGKICVYKASEFFSHSKIGYVFRRRLRGQCFDRTLEFIEEKRDYRAVLSFEDNLLGGGHFHTYLEKGNMTLDISSNALYIDEEEKNKVLNGQVLEKINYDEIQSYFDKVREEIPNISSNANKLAVLALYHGMKKGIK